MPLINCPVCRIEFYKRPWLIKVNKSCCCSRECSLKYKHVLYPEGNQKCKECGVSYRTNPAYIKRLPGQKRFCSNKCRRLYHHKNLKIVMAHGYETLNKKRVHRIIMEEYLGRTLGPKEHVHHKNAIKTDNRIENLVVMSHKEHEQWHKQHETKVLVLTCKTCNKDVSKPFYYVNKKYDGNYERARKDYQCQKCYYLTGGPGGRRLLLSRNRD